MTPLTFGPSVAYIMGEDGKIVASGKVVENPVLIPDYCIIVTRPCNVWPISKWYLGTFTERLEQYIIDSHKYHKQPRFTYKTNMDYINRRRYNGHKRPRK